MTIPNVLANRYAGADLARIWSPEHKIVLERQLWIAVLKAQKDLGIDVAWYTHRNRPMDEVLPWDHVNVKKGREYLEKEQQRSLIQLQVMANAT